MHFFSQGGTPMSFSTVFSIYREVFGSRPNSLVENTVDGSEIPNNHLGCMYKTL